MACAFSIGAEYDDFVLVHGIEALSDRERRRQEGIGADPDQCTVGDVVR
jgi:hypothetical protein